MMKLKKNSGNSNFCAGCKRTQRNVNYSKKQKYLSTQWNFASQPS